MKTNVREAGGVQVVELKGKITTWAADGGSGTKLAASRLLRHQAVKSDKPMRFCA